MQQKKRTPTSVLLSHVYFYHGNNSCFFYTNLFLLFSSLVFLQADVYSFGLLLCEMCIRELPVPQQIRKQIGLVTNDVLWELIMSCASRDPEARPAISDVISVLMQQAESLRAQGLVTINGWTATL